MHPKILGQFWSDHDFERFDGAELAGHRLTWLWCLTTPITNAAGVFPENRRAFTGETGQPFDQLERTMNAFPKAFLRDPDSRHTLIRNYIRHQIGSGPTLATDNMGATVLKAVRVSPEPLARAVLEIYPDLRFHKGFRSPCQALAKPLPSGSVPCGTLPNGEALAKPLPRASGSPVEGEGKGNSKGEGKGEGSAEGASDSEVGLPTEAEVQTWGQFEGVPPECCRDFFDWHASRGWMSGNTRISRPRRLLRSYFATWADRQSKKAPVKNGPSRGATGQADADDLRAQLQTETDPTRREELERKLKAAS